SGRSNSFCHIRRGHCLLSEPGQSRFPPRWECKFKSELFDSFGKIPHACYCMWTELACRCCVPQRIKNFFIGQYLSHILRVSSFWLFSEHVVKPLDQFVCVRLDSLIAFRLAQNSKKVFPLLSPEWRMGRKKQCSDLKRVKLMAPHALRITGFSEAADYLVCKSW